MDPKYRDGDSESRNGANMDSEHRNDANPDSQQSNGANPVNGRDGSQQAEAESTVETSDHNETSAGNDPTSATASEDKRNLQAEDRNQNSINDTNVETIDKSDLTTDDSTSGEKSDSNEVNDNFVKDNRADYDEANYDQTDYNEADYDQADYNEADYDQADHDETNDEADFDEDDDEEEYRPPSKLGRRVGFVIAFCILFLLAGTVVGVGMFLAIGLQPVEAKEQEIRITIEPGSSSARIAQILEDNGLIRSEFVFRYYLRINNQGSRFQAGEYIMRPGMSLDEIIEMLNSGNTVQIPTFRFTIPEGYTVEKIADKLSAEGLIDRDKFMELTDQLDLFQSRYVDQIPDHPDIAHRLEGYMFPETYEMKEGSNEQEIIQRMISELDRKLAQLPDDWENRLEELGLTFHELLTIASLIEREVAVDAERPLVASVIYNRLKQGMKLQIDATVQYALEEHKERLLTVDTQIESPYNTYHIMGLPPGPIASPGIESIRAALYPAESNYLFYVTKKDGSQEHLFAETYEQHQRNKAQSERQ